VRGSVWGWRERGFVGYISIEKICLLLDGRVERNRTSEWSLFVVIVVTPLSLGKGRLETVLRAKECMLTK
jgi:hypothetical protein